MALSSSVALVWVLNQCGSWRVVVGCGGSRVEDRGGSVCRLRWWRRGDWFFFFWVIMWWLFLVDVAIVGGFWRLKYYFFSPLWWLFLVVVVMVGGGFNDLSCGFSCGCGLLGLI